MASENQMVVKLKIIADTSQVASEALREIKGVDKVDLMSSHRLRVTYDVNETGWAVLRERLQAVGAYTQAGRFARWRDGWREFVEQNMRANLQHKPACCSKPPVGGGLRSRTHHD